MKKYLSSIIKFIISLSIGIALIYWFMGQMSENEKQQVVEDIKRANYFWLIFTPCIGLISNYFRAERWRMLLEPLGYKPGFWNTMHSVMIMYFANLFVPRLGEVTRCGVLARYENVPLDKAIGTMVVERVLDVICLAVLALGLLVAEREKFMLLYQKIMVEAKTTFADTIAKYQISPEVQYGVFGAILILVIIFLFLQFRKKGATYIFEKAKENFWGLLRSLISIKDTGKPFTLLFHTVMIWVCYLVMAYLNFRVFPETSHLSFLAGGICLFFAGVAYSITPGGLGLYPIFMTIILTLYGVTGSAVNSLGLLAWTVQTIFVLGQGLISFTYLAIIGRQAALQKEP